MPVFAYTGSAADQTVRGTITADTPRVARDQLRAGGIDVRTMRAYEKTSRQRFAASDAIDGSSPPGSPAAAWTGLSSIRLRSHKHAWAAAVHELSMMLSAGLPMLQSLDTIAQQHSGRFRAALLSVRELVASGSSLAAALSRQSDLADPASIQMVSVGENSGTLDSVLADLADFQQKQLALSDKVTTALVYPAFLIVFGTAAAIFLMTWVLPPLLENLRETVPVLPWPTRVVRWGSELLVNHWLLIIAAVLVTVAAVAIAIRSPRGRRRWHQWLLRMPVIGPMTVKQNVSRIAIVIATLSRSGVELTRAFELAELSTSNVVFQETLRRCVVQISAGREIADALAMDQVLPPLAIQVFSIGQESGRLDEMLFRLADDYDRQVALASTRLTALVEPVLILVLAVAIGFLLLATVLPILEAGNVVGG